MASGSGDRRRSTRVSEAPGIARQAYFLPLRRDCGLSCSYCGDVGFRPPRDRSQVDIVRSLSKAKGGGYDAVLTPCNVPVTDVTATIRPILPRGCDHAIAIVNIARPLVTFEMELAAAANAGVSIVIAIGDHPPDLETKFAVAEASGTVLEYWIVVQATLDVAQVVEVLPLSATALLRFCFPRPDGGSPKYLDTQAIRALGRRVASMRPGLAFRPPSVVEPYEPRIPEEIELEPVASVTPIVAGSDSPVVSVIVPSHQPGRWLPSVLLGLANQEGVTCSPETFEVLIVDDGGHEAIATAARSAFAGFGGAVTLLRLQRRQGEAVARWFRAGVARNAGARHARGRYLIFVDHDMLVDPRLVATLLRDLDDETVIQCRRQHLQGVASNRVKSHHEVGPSDTYVSDEGYWLQFYSDVDGSGWDKLDHPYKYVCSHGLALNRDLFERVGGFRKTFPGYGFEDTELGYRLWRAGAQLRLSSLTNYHYETPARLINGASFDRERDRALAVTARKFYHLTLDPEVFEHFSAMFTDDAG